MAKIPVTVLQQKVFHDGLSMVVLKPGDENAAVEASFVQGLVDEGVIDPPDGFEPPVEGGFETEDDDLSLVAGELLPFEHDGLAERVAELEAWKAEALPILEQVKGWQAQLEQAQTDVQQARDRVDPLDHDGDGERGGSKADDELVDESGGFTLTDAAGGWWHIAGPGLDEPVKVRGEDAARVRFAEIVAAAADEEAPPA